MLGAQGLLATSLRARLLVRRSNALEKPAHVPPFLTALDEVRASNKTLRGVADEMWPMVDSSCAEYSEALDLLIGHGNDLAGTVKAKQDSDDESGGVRAGLQPVPLHRGFDRMHGVISEASRPLSAWASALKVSDDGGERTVRFRGSCGPNQTLHCTPG